VVGIARSVAALSVTPGLTGRAGARVVSPWASAVSAAAREDEEGTQSQGRRKNT